MRQFDASLADPLFHMPPTALPDTNTLGTLSQRNLQRGRKMGLPSGERVAKAMGVTPLTPTQLYTDRSIKVTIPIASSRPGITRSFASDRPAACFPAGRSGSRAARRRSARVRLGQETGGAC